MRRIMLTLLAASLLAGCQTSEPSGDDRPACDPRAIEIRSLQPHRRIRSGIAARSPQLTWRRGPP